MKNLHLLPTDKPSRLVYINGTSNKYHLLNYNDNKNYESFNIYITNDEEIKEGDWVFDAFINACPIIRQLRTNEEVIEVQKTEHKIILTTDQKLINDDVQAIPDEFLEWFVKNSSCEFVEVIKDKCLDTSLMCDCVDEPCRNKGYKIIIPKEEPTDFLGRTTFDLLKQEAIEEEMKEFDKQEPTLANMKCTCMRFEANCFSGVCRNCGFPPKEEPNQKTIEEVAFMLMPDRNGFTNRDRFNFIEGANYREIMINALKVKLERSYSAEDMREMYNKSCGLIGLGELDDQTENDKSFRELISKFKNK